MNSSTARPHWRTINRRSKSCESSRANTLRYSCFYPTWQRPSTAKAAQLEAKEFKKARQDCESARELFKKLCNISPSQPVYHRELGRVLANLARIAHAQSEDTVAIDLYRQASTEHEQVLILNPESVPDQRLLQLVQKELEAFMK